MKRNFPIFIILFVFFLSTCQMSRKGDVKKIFDDWMDKEILIPDDVMFKFFGRDTLCSYLWNKSHKIFTYIDSIGCSSCQLDLFSWKGFIDSCHRQQIDIGFIFVVHSSDFKRFNEEVRFEKFDYPIIYDHYNKFYILNHFPQRPYRTFLLDKDNKIKLIGSPVDNPQMWELYKKVIEQSQ